MRIRERVNWVGNVSPNSVTNNGRFCFIPGDAFDKAMKFQAQKSSQGQADMITLSGGGAGLTSFDANDLFDTPMIGFDHPAPFCEFETAEFVHFQVTRGPVFNVAVRGNQLEHLDEAIAFDLNFAQP